MSKGANGLQYYSDDMRHLVCVPYSTVNLHRMAQDLGIKRCWFHKDHYDIPRKRVSEVHGKTNVVSPVDILRILKEAGVR